MNRNILQLYIIKFPPQTQNSYDTVHTVDLPRPPNQAPRQAPDINLDLLNQIESESED